MLVENMWTSEYLANIPIEKEELSNHIVGIVQPKTFANEYKIIQKELNFKIKNEESFLAIKDKLTRMKEIDDKQLVSQAY